MARKLTYKRSGVDIDKANDFLKTITPLVEKTHGKGTVGKIGHFGGFFKADTSGMKEPILVSAADGVGTKLLVACAVNKFDTIGIDLVAMCVNDVIACGAVPLFFLDYFATGRIKKSAAVNIVKGIVNGCMKAGCALIGGETAEMPDLYEKGRFDLAGFCVGVVDKKGIIDGSKVKAGDRVLGLASSGIHANGYSLVRNIFSKSEIKGRYKNELLKATAIYARPLLEIMKGFEVKAAAHITGGGFYDNIPRVLPTRTAVTIDKGSWRIPPIFDVIKKKSGLCDEELYRTFNMGIGMVVVVEKDEARPVLEKLKKMKVKAWDIGEVIKWAKKEVIL